MQVLNKELESEMARTKMDISSMDVRIKGEYINRLKVEVDILRGTYDKFMKDTWEQLEAEYKDAIKTGYWQRKVIVYIIPVSK